MRLFKKQYQADLKKVGPGEEKTQLAKKKRWRPLTLGDLDDKVQQYIKALRKAGTPVNSRVISAAAEGIVKATDRTLLLENGGLIKLTLDWTYSLLRRMCYVKRKATTKARIALDQEQFAAFKKRYLQQIKTVVKDGKIPPELVINWDQTGISVVPSFNWTQAEKGTSRIEIAGAGDKCQITVTVAGTLSGKIHVLPFQILYEGKTEQCHPHTQFPEGFDIWHTPNHWANSDASIRFVENIILPYVCTARKELVLGEEHMALVIFDTFKGHTGNEMESLMLKNNIVSVIVPSNCTDALQPLDLSVNKPLKDNLRSKFQSWYSEKVSKQMDSAKKPEDIQVDMKLSVMKPISARWIVSVYDYLRSESGIVCGVFVEAGISEELGENESSSDQGDDPLADIESD